MQKITPFLWFDDNAEEAVNRYVAIFPDSKIVSVHRIGDARSEAQSKVVMVIFDLAGQRYMALNGGPQFKLTEAFSLLVKCDTQAELDTYWNQLLDGGQAQRCGWLKDKFGLSWQIVPTVFSEMMSDPDPAKHARVMQAMMQMVKFDIAALERAYEQR